MASKNLVERLDVVIAPLVGPEVIAGSTRMKGGLAQKMVLHLLSTTVMVRLGYVSGNLMSNVQPASRKLQERAVHILMTLSRTEREEAEAGRVLPRRVRRVGPRGIGGRASRGRVRSAMIRRRRHHRSRGA